MIFKLAVWGFVGLLVLPSVAPVDVRKETQPVSSIAEDGTSYDGQVNAITFVTGLAQDLTGLCMRQPEICAQGAKVADTAIMRAEHGLRVAYAMVIDHRDKMNTQAQ